VEKMGFLKIVYYSTMVLTWFGSTFVQGSFPGMRIFEGIKQDSVDMIAKALEEGDDINSIGPGEQTPLMHATLMGKPKSVKFLLKQGADPTIGEKDGYTPVHGICFYHCYNLVNFPMFATIKMLIMFRRFLSGSK